MSCGVAEFGNVIELFFELGFSALLGALGERRSGGLNGVVEASRDMKVTFFLVWFRFASKLKAVPRVDVTVEFCYRRMMVEAQFLSSILWFHLSWQK